jgi:hypothetical protein
MKKRQKYGSSDESFIKASRGYRTNVKSNDGWNGDLRHVNFYMAEKKKKKKGKYATNDI